MIVVCCHYCGDDLDPDGPLTYRRVLGWERKARSASRRGGSDVLLREPGVEFACSFCLENLKAGRPARQEGLL